MADRPSNVKYTKSHEWVRIEDGEATVGITDFAVEHLGDLVFVELPDVGSEVDQGASLCEIESVKAVAEVYAPVAGEVTAVNEDLANDQAPLAADPFGAGWLLKLAVRDEGTTGLMDLPAYEQQLAAEAEAD